MIFPRLLMIKILIFPVKRSPNTKVNPSFPQLITAVNPLDNKLISFCPSGTFTIIIAIMISAINAIPTFFHSTFFLSHEIRKQIAKTINIPTIFNTNFIYFFSYLFNLICREGMFQLFHLACLHQSCLQWSPQ